MDVAEEIKLAQGIYLRKHFLHIHFGRVSHVICHTTLFAHCPSSALFWVPGQLVCAGGDLEGRVRGGISIKGPSRSGTFY